MVCAFGAPSTIRGDALNLPVLTQLGRSILIRLAWRRVNRGRSQGGDRIHGPATLVHRGNGDSRIAASSGCAGQDGTRPAQPPEAPSPVPDGPPSPFPADVVPPVAPLISDDGERPGATAKKKPARPNAAGMSRNKRHDLAHDDKETRPAYDPEVQKAQNAPGEQSQPPAAQRHWLRPKVHQRLPNRGRRRAPPVRLRRCRWTD